MPHVLITLSILSLLSICLYSIHFQQPPSSLCFNYQVSHDSACSPPLSQFLLLISCMYMSWPDSTWVCMSFYFHLYPDFPSCTPEAFKYRWMVIGSIREVWKWLKRENEVREKWKVERRKKRRKFESYSFNEIGGENTKRWTMNQQDMVKKKVSDKLDEIKLKLISFRTFPRCFTISLYSFSLISSVVFPIFSRLLHSSLIVFKVFFTSV